MSPTSSRKSGHVGSLEGAALFSRRIGRARGNSPAAIAKEFGLDMILRDGGAVEFDEDAVLA